MMLFLLSIFFLPLADGRYNNPTCGCHLVDKNKYDTGAYLIFQCLPSNLFSEEYEGIFVGYGIKKIVKFIPYCIATKKRDRPYPSNAKKKPFWLKW
jgi:hypothetical protein